MTDEADVVLISHLHRDHLDLRSLRRLPPGTPLVVPRGAAGLVAKAGAEQIHEIGVGETIEVAGVELTAVAASHNGYRDGPWGTEIEPAGYVISGGGKQVYFAGDTDLFDEMAEVGPVDLALLPVWGWGPSLGPGHMDPLAAAHALTLLRPRVAVPIHWGTFYPLTLRRWRPKPLSDPPHEFAAHASRFAPEVEVRILAPGESLEIA